MNKGDYSKEQGFYHAALVLSGKLKIGTKQANKELRKLLMTYGSFKDIYKAIKGLFDKKTQELSRLEKKINNNEFYTLTINDEEFPAGLKCVEYATPVIYFKGDINLVKNKTMAVVGTRKLDENNHNDNYMLLGIELIKRLVDNNYTIISGLAKGCDSLAHNYALAFNGKTIAVLGTPIDKYYPKENKRLQDIIAKEHLLISQYPIGIKTYPSYFAHRNITLVSLSKDGLVVIFAKDKSGTIYAVEECIKQNKPLYALSINFDKGFDWVEKYKPKEVRSRLV